MKERSFRMIRMCGGLMVTSLAVLVVSCGGDSPTGGPPPPVPFITSLSDTALVPGDTLEVSGGNFASEPRKIRVVFDNELAAAMPVFATTDSLRVVVPTSANSGPMTVVSLGVRSEARVVTVERGIGDVWITGGSASFDFKVAANSTARYLIVPFSAATAPEAVYAYSVTPQNVPLYPSPPALAVAGGGMATTNQAIEFERRRWADARRQLEAYRGELRFETVAREAAPAETRTFRVLRCNPCAPGEQTHTTVTADLVYTGSTALVYADQDQPTGSFTQADYVNFGTQFDNAIFRTDSTFFGPATDIDNNGKIAILFTPRVNDLTPDGTAQSQGFISGFFAPLDLAPSVAAPGTSNAMEIFYVVVPDPQGERGNALDRQKLLGIIPATLAHELEHMISFGYRITTIGLSAAQVTWFEEGMAHMAEDLNNMDGDNVARANLFLTDTDKVSLLGDDTLQQRGGIFLFLRYLCDRFGEDILLQMVRSECKGAYCVYTATGHDFFELVSEYYATLYLSNRGITNDPAFNFRSFDISRAPFSQLYVRSRQVSQGTFSGGVHGAAGAHYVLDGFASPGARFAVTGASNGRVRVIAARIR